jgi:hypothetical protein
MRRYCSAGRRAWFAAYLVLLSAAVTACTSSSQQITGPGSTSKCSISVTSSLTDFGADGGEGRLTVTAERDCRWKVQTEAPWVTIGSQDEVQGSGTASFVVAPASDPVARTASLTIADQHVNITQRAAPCRYRLSADRMALPSPGGGGGVDVTASSGLCEWTAQADADWVAISSGRTYKGNARVTFQAAAWGGPERRANISIADQQVTLTQSGGCTFALASPSASIAAGGGRATVAVQTGPGCAWTAASSAAWVTIAIGAATNGPAAVEFAIEPNTGPARSTTVTVAGHPFSIDQASGCQYQLTPAAWTFGAAGGPGAVVMNTAAGCSWTAESEADWLTVTSARTGSGPTSVQISVAVNSGPQRAAAVRVGGQRFVATQLTGCTYSIKPTSWGFPAAGAADWVWVTATPGCFWNATSQANWLTITTGGAGYGSAITYFAVAPNGGPPRQGTLTIAGLTFTAVQEGASSGP